MSETAEAGASHIPELFRSVITPPAPAAVTKKAEENVAAIVENTKGWWREALAARVPSLVAALGGNARAWWTRARVHRVTEASLPNRYVDALAVEGASPLPGLFLVALNSNFGGSAVLCRLVCASLAEDTFGVVQRDIPKILEALLAFLEALEEYQAELNAKYAMPSEDILAGLAPKEVAERETLVMEAARASEVCWVVTDGECPLSLSDRGRGSADLRFAFCLLSLRFLRWGARGAHAHTAIKEGIVQIVRTFGEKLAAFKFPPRVAGKLQGFVDYN